MYFAELYKEFRSGVPILIWIALSLPVSIMGPFGTYGLMSFFDRLVFWPALLAIGIAVGSALRVFVHAKLALTDIRRGAVLMAVLMCLVVCPPLYAILMWMFDDALLPLPGLGEIVLMTASLSLGICSLRMSMSGKTPIAQRFMANEHGGLGTDGATGGAPVPRLLQRLEPDLQGRLWSISVRDHYVDLATDRGSASLLLRLGDAIAEADPEPGGQVHRSHWVAWDAVEGVERDGSKLRLRLRSGQVVPVSRNHRAKVDALWPEPANAALE